MVNRFSHEYLKNISENETMRNLYKWGILVKRDINNTRTRKEVDAEL